MNNAKIEWCDLTWNPIVGCRNKCRLCWAKRMNGRFHYIPNFENPRFFPSRLSEPEKEKKPAKIAVCLMGDIFSPGVHSDWINLVFSTIRKSNRHTFMLLTKFPVRYYEFDIPPNCWLGTSVSSNLDNHRAKVLSEMTSNLIKFLSVEPLLGSMAGVDLSNFDHVFVGSQTGPGAVVPENEWIGSINHPSILWKNNIKKYLF